MQGTGVLGWEDPPCCGATKPVHHRLLEPTHLEPVLCNRGATAMRSRVYLKGEQPQLKAHVQQ